MAVLDASVVVEMLLRTSVGRNAFDRASTASDGMHAPHLVDIEVAHALRRLARSDAISSPDATFAVEVLPQLRIDRHAHLLLLPRIWQLREALSAYDAAYVSLAEILDMPLLTCDAKLSRSHGHRAQIILLQ